MLIALPYMHALCLLSSTNGTSRSAPGLGPFSSFTMGSVCSTHPWQCHILIYIYIYIYIYIRLYVLHPMQVAADTNDAVESPTTDAQDAGMQQVPDVQEAEKQLSNKKV